MSVVALFGLRLAMVLLPLMGGAAELADRAASAGYSEAPELAERVRRGELPPVEQRLPATPALVQPVERAGNYGGSWRMAIIESGDLDILYRTIGYEPLVSWDRAWSRTVPNVAEWFSVTNEARDYLFRLRPGLRWSDGVPLTADDVVFWHEVHPTDALGGVELEVEKVDDLQVRFRFAEPHGLLPEYLASPRGVGVMCYPRHYLSRYHPKYNRDADANAKAAGFSNWFDQMEFEAYAFSPGRLGQRRPTVSAWTLLPLTLVSNKAPDLRPGDVLTAVRNPYYWKVDTRGAQLPYLDKVEFRVADSLETMVQWAESGLLDMQYFYIGGEENRARLAGRAARGRYHLSRRPLSLSSATALSLNITHPHPGLRRLFELRDFRVALSVAIDRAAMVRDIGLGMSEPYQVAPRPESPFYNARLARQYTEYDPKRAAALLDQAGCAGRDPAGFRLRPDGQRLRIQIAFCDSPYYSVLWRVVARQVAEYWQRIGVDASLRYMTRTDLYVMKDRNEHDAIIWEGEGGTDPMMELRYYAPVSWESNYGVGWYDWSARATTRGVEPPPVIREQLRRC